MSTRGILAGVGAVIGFYFGGPAGAQLGASIGGAIGGAIDPTVIEGPRLTDLNVTSSTYGNFIPLIYGPENRVGGNLIWSTGLIEDKSEDDGKGGTQVNTYSYRESFAISFSGRPGVRVEKIWANGKLIFDVFNNTYAILTRPHLGNFIPDEYTPALPIADPTPEVGMVCTREHGTHSVFDTLRVYQGNGTQQIDPTIEAHKGVGQTQAYRHTFYIVITDLQLADFGNFHPNIEVKMVADEEIAASAVVNDICTRANIATISSTQVRGEVTGYAVARASTAYSALLPLAVAYSFDVAEQWGQIRCVMRGGPIRGVLAAGDFGGAPPGGRRPDPYKLLRMPQTELPKQVSVNYKDAAIDFQINTQTASRQYGSTESNVVVELPMTFTPDRARRLADMILWGTWANRRAFKSKTNDHWVRRQAGEMIGFSILGTVLPFKITRVNRGANGVIDWELMYEDPEVYRSAAVGAGSSVPANDISFPGPTTLVLFNTSLLRSGDDDGGFYWAVDAAEAGWRGASVLRSTDGQVYGTMSRIGLLSAMGGVSAAVPPGPTDFWDDGTVITVEIERQGATLESVSDLEVLNGANAAWLGRPDGQGGEVLQFGVATLVAPSTYQLSRLLRGRRGTEHAVGGHGPGEAFVLLGAGLGRTDFTSADWDKVRYYKPVSILTAEVDTPEQQFVGTGEALRPWSPVHPAGSRDASNNLTLTWTRRTRLFTPGLGAGPVPLGEEAEAWEVDILVGSSAVVRTLTSTGASVIYTAAEQAADGITPGAQVSGEVYQMSAVRGRGHAMEFTV